MRGDRAEGWLPQTRSEVMAQNGIVSTGQPLAAQAGLRILMQGGNAVDAAAATAAALNSWQASAITAHPKLEHEISTVTGIGWEHWMPQGMVAARARVERGRATRDS